VQIVRAGAVSRDTGMTGSVAFEHSPKATDVHTLHAQRAMRRDHELKWADEAVAQTPYEGSRAM